LFLREGRPVEVGEGGGIGVRVSVCDLKFNMRGAGDSLYETFQWKSCQIRKKREKLMPRSCLLKLSNLLEYDIFFK